MKLPMANTGVIQCVPDWLIKQHPTVRLQSERDLDGPSISSGILPCSISSLDAFRKVISSFCV